MVLGPLMLDLEGIELDHVEKEILRHPMVGGLIFFKRNFESKQQITDLVRCVREQRPEILICVDHEGGRVQRFREGFAPLPALRKLGHWFDHDQAKASAAAAEMAWLMAVELRDVGIDFSFAPVLDLDHQRCQVIGDRAFHQDKEKVTALAKAYVRGLREVGMANVGKHFPGHGYVNEDSHLELPVDRRELNDIWSNDVYPFEQLNAEGLLDAVMPAHVVYEQIDSQPAGFSPTWIRELLRGRMGFDGVVFSDDLNMAAAHVAGNFADRAEAAIQAGCDMILVCNNRKGAVEVLDKYRWTLDTTSTQRLERMRAKPMSSASSRADVRRHQNALALADHINQSKV
ncbi:MAG: beta-N-acetylhexosaminidase [Gammaproteobacteria bacterium]|nr:beta-N-acetylhexosaminidase [Gammaproteobacteria bacterium]